MRVLAFGVAFRCIYGVCNNLLAGDGRAHISAYVFTLSIAVITLLSFILVPYMGIVGAAWADMFAGFLVMVMAFLPSPLNQFNTILRLLLFQLGLDKQLVFP